MKKVLLGVLFTIILLCVAIVTVPLIFKDDIKTLVDMVKNKEFIVR